MSLGRTQEDFTYALGKLIVWAYEEQEVRLRTGDMFRDPRAHGKWGEKKGYGTANSVHKQKLACDLNLFINGEWITDSQHPTWKTLHGHWETLGGAKMIPNDANHFSFAYGEYR